MCIGGGHPKDINHTLHRKITFTFASRPVIDQEALQEATRAQFFDNNDELIEVPPERLAALAEVAATASTREDLVSAGHTLIQGELEQLGARGMQNLLDGVASGSKNVEKEFGLVEEAPHGSYLENHARNGAEASNKNSDLLTFALFGKVFADVGGLVMDVITGDTKAAACKFGAIAGGFAGGFAGTPLGLLGVNFGYTAGSIAFEEGCRAANDLESERLKSASKIGQTHAKYSHAVSEHKANGFYTENPMNEHLTEDNFLAGTRDYDLRMEVLRNYDPTRDPSEENAGNGYQRIIEDVGVIQSMGFFHGGTSTGAFQEQGSLRLDQLDFSGFLGSHGGTSTGGGQLI
ncbi:hypothetical protein OAZ24_00475 [Synechococcus sp. AH-736-G21]|nr:hypothetical protein [Synechococcus sp. AH-736-G21]